ncbi:hypothetical protein LTR78_003894 [Recurvomyces mirabilis]|uniref:Uncharacterized protein n=1 Tax=Recurvomyces mirabilis TaxID=574656 RepID=A0AAE0WQI2_9PEZI|nr:hypothetical protein LTR78_003894 [Recurvomyces mirabilis]KAK5153967.1 hypothetical protein LTS14_007187 [Recurvomyces mirabilis]
MPFLAQEHFPVPTKDIPSWTFDNIKYDQDEPIYIDALNPKKNSVSARQAKQYVHRLVAGLHAQGLQKGDCVCMHSPNHILYPLVFMGVVAAGGVFAATNPAYTPYEMVHALKIAKVKFVIAQLDLVKSLEKAMQDVGMSKDKVVVFNPDGEAAPDGYKVWSDLISHGEKDWNRFDDLQTAKHTEAARLFSSGTTGLPKAASLSHYNLVAQHTLVYESIDRPWRAKRLIALPMFHAASAPVAFTTPLRAGEPAYVLARFDLEKWFWAMQEYGITDVALVPPVAIMAINSPLREKYTLKSARTGGVGAAPLDAKAQARFQALMAGGDASLTQVWGMTETSCICTRFPYPDKDITGSVGRPLPNIDLKLVDDSGKDISGYDIRGEICARGPTIINGYFENPEANKRDWDDEGFFHTGDIAYCDGKTKLWYIVDRKKELIKVRGFQVTPPELEGLLLDHSGIVDAAVIGVPAPQEKDGELPRAYLVRRPGGDGKLTEQEVHAYMQEKLASYKQLTGGIVFSDAIPKNASGKILKRVLREQAKKEMGAKL